MSGIDRNRAHPKADIAKSPQDTESRSFFPSLSAAIPLTGLAARAAAARSPARNPAKVRDAPNETA